MFCMCLCPKEAARQNCSIFSSANSDLKIGCMCKNCVSEGEGEGGGGGKEYMLAVSCVP